MFRWKYLDIDNWETIHQELTRYLPNMKNYELREPTETDNTRLTYLNKQETFSECPSLRDYFKSIGKHNHKMSIIKFIIKPYFDHIPHVDNAEYYNLSEPPAGGFTKWCLGFNFPLENCDNTYTCFYKTKTNDITVNQTIDRPDKPHFGVYRRIDSDDLVEIDRYYLNKPILINTSVPHRVVNENLTERVAITIRINPDAWELTK